MTNRRHATTFVRLLLCAALLLPAISFAGKKSAKPTTLHHFQLKDIAGKKVSLASMSGKVVLLVNVASNCGYTYQYKGLQALHAKFGKKGLLVVGIPANNFGGQEPGTNAQIKQFCTSKFKVTFPMMAKISVKGADMHPLYKWLTNRKIHAKTGGDVSWNFNKFLIGKDGRVVARFGSGEEPTGKAITSAVKKLL